MQDFELKDGDRVVRFTGALIGSASSARDGKTRWSEISIYVTVGHKYVVQGVGRTTLENEVDKYWVQVCEKPQCVVEKLHMYDDSQSRYLPYTNRRALDEARSRDRELAEAFAVETVD